MNISSRSLFHFTPKYEFLIGILSRGYRYSLLHESIPKIGYTHHFSRIIQGTRAVCFCDLPLILSQQHRDQYGNYVIGMDKEWGKSVGLTPVRYIHNDSPDLRRYTIKKLHEIAAGLELTKGDVVDFYVNYLNEIGYEGAPTPADIDKLPEGIIKLLYVIADDYMEMFQQSYHLLGLSRIFEGEWQDRSTQEAKQRIFYDEREWRGITNIEAEDYLQFQFKHVNHLIVTTPDERKNLGTFLLLEENRKRLQIQDETEVWSKIRVGEELFTEI